jgi:uncharacterized protein YndB with AHSA1/START domain
MAAKDGSVSFDFEGVYTKVEPNKMIEFTIADGRRVEVNIQSQGNSTKGVESFEAEDSHTIDMQGGGWLAILDNFRKHTESV